MNRYIPFKSRFLKSFSKRPPAPVGVTELFESKYRPGKHCQASADISDSR